MKAEVKYNLIDGTPIKHTEINPLEPIKELLSKTYGCSEVILKWDTGFSENWTLAK